MRLLPSMLLLCWCLPADAGICDTVRALVQNEANKQEIPAISVAIVQDNRIACSVSLGFADLEHRIPNTVNSRHRLASLSKPVTAVLTMQLVEQGRLALDDSVRKFLPDLPARYDPVTVRRLLSHQSGIREYAGLEEVFSTRHYPTLEEAARAIFLDSPLLFPPGTRTAYTTYGYTLLGAVVEKVTGQPFHQMRLPTGFALDDYRAITPGRVRPYRRNTSRTGWENAPFFDASNKYPGGGLISNAVDYARFLISVGSGGQLRQDTLNTMWTPQRLSDGSVVPFATLGWATGIRGQHRYFTHGGLQPGTTTLMHWFPSIGAGSVVLSNAEGPDLDPLQDSILKALLPRER